MNRCDRTGCHQNASRAINIHGNIYYWCQDHIFMYLEPILNGREDEAIKAVRNSKYETNDGFADLMRANPLWVGKSLEWMKKTKSEKT